MYFVALWLVKLGYFLFYNIKVEGRENLPKHGGIVVASNHRSFADPPLIAILFPFCRCTFMAKEELFQKPLFAWLIRGLGAFPVTRGGGDTGVIDEAAARVRAGKNLLIFPEGTRSKTGKVGRGKTGVAMVAARTGAEVVPVGITFTGKLHFRSKILIRIGKPIAAEELAISPDAKPRELVALKTRIMAEITALVDEPADPLPQEESNG